MTQVWENFVVAGGGDCTCCGGSACCTSTFSPNGDSSSLVITGSSPTFTLSASTSKSFPTLSLGFSVGACVALAAGSVLVLTVTNIDGTCAGGGGFLAFSFAVFDPDGNPLSPTSTTEFTATYDISTDGCYCCSLAMSCVGLSAGPVAGDLIIDSDMAIGCSEIAPPP